MLPINRTQLALAMSNQIPSNVLASSPNKGSLVEAYNTIDELYSFVVGLLSQGTLSKLGTINVRDYNASGSPYSTTGSITQGTDRILLASVGDFVVGQGLLVEGVHEVSSLEVTLGASSTANCTVTLNGVAFTVALTSGQTATQVATAIRASSFPGWTTGGTGTTVTFTSNSSGIKTDSSYSAGTTGATGTMTTTTQGTSDLVGIIQSIVNNVATLNASAASNLANRPVYHDDTTAITNAINAVSSSFGRLELSGGSYPISSTIQETSKDNLFISNGEIINKSGSLAFLFTECDYLRLERVTINSNNTSITGIRVIDSLNPMIVNSQFRNALGVDCSLIRIIGCSDAVVYNCLVENVMATNTGVGIYIDDSATNKSDDFSVQKCVIRNIYPTGDGDGFKLQSACKNGIINNNKFLDCQKRAIKVQPNASLVPYEWITITNNYMEGGMVYCAVDLQCGNGIIDNNEMIDFQGSAILIQESNCTVTNNRMKSITAITTTSGSAIIITSLGYTTLTEKKIVIDNNTFSGTALYAVVFRDLMVNQKSVTITNNVFNGLNGRRSVFSLSTATIDELVINNNVALVNIGNYLAFFESSAALLVNTFIMKNNAFPTAQSVVQFARATLATMCANANNVELVFLSGIYSILVSGSAGVFKYTYSTTVVPSSISAATPFYFTNLANSKIGDYSIKPNATMGTDGRMQIGWICVADSSGPSPRGVWEEVVVTVERFHSGTSANRPVTTLVGFPYFDTTLGKPVFYNGSSYMEHTRLVAVPLSATATGVVGDIAFDSSFIYVCHATNTWKRVGISTW